MPGKLMMYWGRKYERSNEDKAETISDELYQ